MSPTIRRCVRCHQPITFSFLKLPIVASRRTPTVIAHYFAHVDDAACARETEFRTAGREDLAARLAHHNDAAALEQQT